MLILRVAEGNEWQRDSAIKPPLSVIKFTPGRSGETRDSGCCETVSYPGSFEMLSIHHSESGKDDKCEFCVFMETLAMTLEFKVYEAPPLVIH